MDFLFIVIFLIVNLLVVGVFAGIYGGKYKYKDGMILGVHIPSYAADDPEVSVITENYRKQSKKIYLWSTVISLGVMLFYYWYLSLFMIAWSIWLIGWLTLATVHLFRSHRRMYDLKVEKNWLIGPPVQTVLVDTNVSLESDKLPLSYWWHLPVILLTLGAFFFIPGFKEYWGAGWESWILPGTILMLELLFCLLHYWYNNRRNVVYSMDSQVNLTLNRLDKRIWSVIWLLTDYLNFIAFMVLIYPLKSQDKLGVVNFFVFCAIQAIMVSVLFIGALVLKNRRSEILSEDKKTVLVDDDVYWKNGWYYNPDDKQLMVQDRLCSINFTFNMAKTSAKIMTGIALIGTVLLLVWMCAIFVKMDFTKMGIEKNGNQVEILAGSYEYTFSMKEIEDIEVVKALPDEKLNRINGTDTSEYLLGKFRGMQAGNLRLYIYRGYSPILKIVLPEFTIYINSKEPGEVTEWYEALH
ncbi:MAG TPA: hypothetical protein IAC62_08890 [Candidatus Pelethocola excrementipullorum]|nr:hypothetical protein [Candidatus Pelethocola excrementipullorum]